MSLDPALLELLPDTVTIEPFASTTATQASTYGDAVSYRAQITGAREVVIGAGGRELSSNVKVVIPNRVHVDTRDRITLPSGWVPQQPPVLAVRPVGGVLGMNLDATEILL